MDLGHWKTSLTIPADFYGFVYKITCIGNGKWYIGRKAAKFAVTKRPLKGNKNKRHSTITSDFAYYTGSSKKLNADILAFGKDYFTFEIIRFCNSKAELAYQETVAIITSNALFSSQSYNEYLLVRLRNPKA